MRKQAGQILEIVRANMLRTRLVLGLLCLLVILLAVGLYSIRQCSDLGRTITTILDENYATISAMQQIKLSCARLNASVVMKFSGEHQDSVALHKQGIKDLYQNLNIQKKQKQTEEEAAATKRLETAIKDYERESRYFFSLPANVKTIPRRSISELSPKSLTIAELAETIQNLSEQSLLSKKDRSQASITGTVRFLLLAMIVAVVVSLYASFLLGRGILQPIQNLTASIHQIGHGNLDQNVPVLSGDELGQLARSVNLMASRLRLYRESATEKIVRLHQTMKTTIASFPDPIFVLGNDGKIELKNPAAEELILKMEAEGIRGFPPLVEDRIKQVEESEEDYLTDKLKDAVCFHFDRENRFFLLRVLLLRFEDGKKFGVAVVLEDVTKLRLLDDIKSDLVATVSHELKTPLTSVRMALHLLLEKSVGPLNESQEELLSAARMDSERLLRTLNNLLDLARLEATTSALEINDVSVDDLLETAISHTRDMASEKKLLLEKEVEEGLPPVPVDSQRIGHIFTNFLTNAIKHSPDGGVVRIRARKVGESVRVSVLDQGPGVPEEFKPRIFDKFFRVPGQTKTGAGLGLTIAREIALAHGGEVGVINRDTGGCEFYVDLPVA